MPLVLLNKLAAARGGQCLGEAYVNSQTSMRWRCAAWCLARYRERKKAG